MRPASVLLLWTSLDAVAPSLAQDQAWEAQLGDHVLVLDTAVPPLPQDLSLATAQEEHTELRMEGSAESVVGSSGGHRLARRASPPASPAAAPPTAGSVPTDLARPMDSMGSNFSTTSCPDFLRGFLSSATFQSCHPVSMLLEGSVSFFQASKSAVSMTRLLEASCAAEVKNCTSYMSQLASSLKETSACGAEYEEENATVLQAYKGLRAYEMIYSAACLQTTDGGAAAYCLANAMANTTSASNVYLYYLPLNASLRAGAAPACDDCTRRTMAIFQAAAADRAQLVANTYPNASRDINAKCGDTFLNNTLPPARSAAAPTAADSSSRSVVLLLSLAALSIAQLLL